MNHSTRHYLSQVSRIAKVITLLLVLCSVFASAGNIVSIVITKANSAAQSTLTPGTANLTADGTSTQLLTVTVKDANGNDMTSGGADIAITKSSGTGTISSVTDNGNGTYNATVTAPTTTGNGVFVATLAGEAVKGGTDSQTEVTVTYSAGTATKLIIQTQPGGSSSGGLLGTQPVVRIADANGNTVTTSTASVSVTPSTGSTLGGTQTVAAVNGIAIFTNLTLAGTAGTNFTLSFTSGSLTSAPSGNVTVSVGSASKVSITRASVGTASGAAFTTQPQVTIQDAAGNTITSSSDVVTATISSGGTLVGTVTATASSGVATFTDLGISGTTGTAYTITYTVTNLTVATESVTVSMGSASKVAITRASAGTASGSAFTTQPQVTIQDAVGNTMTSASDVVTATISSGGSLVGTVTATASSGVATFSNLGLTGTTGTAYTITYTGSGFTATQSVTVTAALLVIGQEYQGGIIAYILQAGQSIGYIKDGTVATYNYDANVQHGLIAATADPITTGIQWAVSTPTNYQTATVPGSTSTAFGTGARNTTAIVLQNVAGSTYAAGLARAYTGGGYTDWYLPSQSELYYLYTNLFKVNNVGHFAAGAYWSSSQAAGWAGYAWARNFSWDQSYIDTKDILEHVRPVRAF